MAKRHRFIFISLLIGMVSLVAYNLHSQPSPDYLSCIEVSGADLKFSPELWQAAKLAQYTRWVDADSRLSTDFCKHNVPYTEILAGGPPPDGIPPLDTPRFVSVAQADAWLIAGQPVIALIHQDTAKAYPLAILTRHEIANDTLGEIPIAVTFCPLCNAALVFDRRVEGQVLRFGVSGNLRNSDLIMWDDKTLSWWQQFTGEAIVGELTGTTLNTLPSQLVAWEDFKQAYPQGQVLARDGRQYGNNPYVGYDSTAKPFLFTGELDSRLPATARVLGYFSSQGAVAYPLTVLAKKQVVHTQVNDEKAVIFYLAGQLSALDARRIADSRQVGSAAMFYTEVAGQALRFKVEAGKLVDEQTGSVWNVFGRATAGELQGHALRPVLHSQVYFWFAWAAFRPDTVVYAPSLHK